MAVNLKGLKDNARKTSISELNARLADALALGMAIKQAHWNVKGPNFIAVHELLDTVYANNQEHVDTMAERDAETLSDRPDQGAGPYQGDLRADARPW